jgi:hypothetical protein
MPDTTKPGNITTKTTLEQETACFVDDGTNLDCFTFIPTMLEFLPTHAVFSGVRDIWYVIYSPLHPVHMDSGIGNLRLWIRPDGLYDMSHKNVREMSPPLTSVTNVDGAGHYVCVSRILCQAQLTLCLQFPVVMPQKTARIIHSILVTHGQQTSKPKL